ncbi:hypothetical protein AB0910_12855 [Streptomyces sp. NPDC047002]|uniref:shikimate dehydrogenase family protein n=1 Tax=Streptomyces sp. NPDC047002 TaxID=3155475 RepID=UPI0034512D87
MAGGDPDRHDHGRRRDHPGPARPRPCCAASPTPPRRREWPPCCTGPRLTSATRDEATRRPRLTHRPGPLPGPPSRGRLVGENTDLHGMLQALHEAGVTSATHVTVLGAGATACTALAAAGELGCVHATVIARDVERVRIRVRVEPWEAAAAHLSADLVVSALPPGVADALAPLWKRTRPAGTLMDVVYRPRPTVFAHVAEAAGRRIVDGLPMLVHQAARQVTLQTGCPAPPVDAMMRAATGRQAAPYAQRQLVECHRHAGS